MGFETAEPKQRTEEAPPWLRGLKNQLLIKVGEELAGQEIELQPADYASSLSRENAVFGAITAYFPPQGTTRGAKETFTVFLGDRTDYRQHLRRRASPERLRNPGGDDARLVEIPVGKLLQKPRVRDTVLQEIRKLRRPARDREELENFLYPREAPQHQAALPEETVQREQKREAA